MEIGNRIYFGRGPVEFIGTILSLEKDSVNVHGVEIGCRYNECRTVNIRKIDNIKVLSDQEWRTASLMEPAFSESMSAEQYSALQTRLEGLEMSIAAGQEDDTVDEDIRFVEALMERSPWTMCMDTGKVVPKKAVQSEHPASSEPGPEGEQKLLAGNQKNTLRAKP